MLFKTDLHGLCHITGHVNYLNTKISFSWRGFLHSPTPSLTKKGRDDSTVLKKEKAEAKIYFRL